MGGNGVTNAQAQKIVCEFHGAKVEGEANELRAQVLELVRRTTADPRTLGSLFHAVCDELRQIGFTEALALLLTLLEETLNNIVGLCKEQVQRLIERFVETLPRAFRDRLLLLAPAYG